jgi:hypothetical protein
LDQPPDCPAIDSEIGRNRIRVDEADRRVVRTLDNRQPSKGAPISLDLERLELEPAAYAGRLWKFR